MSRGGKVFFEEMFAGRVVEDERGYHFAYDTAYLQNPNAKPISLTLPLRPQEYSGKTMLPFFDGLIPEGWLLDIAQKNWKLDPKDRMGLLLACCKDCIGAVSVVPEHEG
jgi:serine/threonine-protein kinase HipA